MNVLHVSAHPDDELLGAPATLFSLRDGGHAITNLAAGLGPPNQHQKRRLELQEACRRAGFRLLLPQQPLALESSDNLPRAEVQLVAMIRGLLKKGDFDLIISPSPHDAHHGHETIGRAVRRVIQEREQPPRWWMWGLWSDLPLPTILTPFGEKRLKEIMEAVEAHVGLVSHNEYRRLLHGRAQMTSILGPERVFGFGTHSIGAAYGELACEVIYERERWYLGQARLLDPLGPFPPARDLEVGWWLEGASVWQQKEMFIGQDIPFGS